jgi:4-phytase/acid phosphatase
MLSLEQAVSGKPVVGAFGPPSGKLLIISGHDTNISNLAGMLGLSWLTTGYQRDDVPPGSALIFSLWRSRGGRSAVRVQFLTQSLEQMRDALPLSQDHSPSVADLFVPACSSPAAGYPCEWPRFRGYLEQVVGASPGSSPARPAR